jgi:hypothetical protein
MLDDPRHPDLGCLSSLGGALGAAGCDDGHSVVICMGAAVRRQPTMADGSITLGDVAGRTAVLAVACSRCDRAGRYNLDTLIARHGVGFGIPALLRKLSDDCPKRKSVSARAAD